MKKKDIISKLSSIISEGTKNVTRKTILEGEKMEEDYSVDSSGELSLGDTGGEFFPEDMHFGFGMVFQILAKKFLDKIQVGSIPEVQDYSADDIDEFVKVVNSLIEGNNKIPTGVGAELLKKAMELYLIDLEEPSKGRSLVSKEHQREFLLDLILKL